jgi:D-serine deaminase-like pyridoxal phosphate-dependent protein
MLDVPAFHQPNCLDFRLLGGHAYDAASGEPPEEWVRRVAVAERDAAAEAAAVVRAALRAGPREGWNFGFEALGAAADAERLSVSVGSTPTCCLPPPDGLGPAVTEIHPGNYVFFDTAQVRRRTFFDSRLSCVQFARPE